MITDGFVIVPLIIASIVFVLLATTFKNKVVNKFKDQLRKDLYDVVVNQVFSEKELLEKKLEEQMRISIAEKKLLEEQLKEKVDNAKSNYATYKSRNEYHSKQIKELQDKIKTLEKENEQYTKTIKSYLLISDLKLSDLMKNYQLRYEAERRLDRRDHD